MGYSEEIEKLCKIRPNLDKKDEKDKIYGEINYGDICKGIKNGDPKKTTKYMQSCESKILNRLSKKEATCKEIIDLYNGLFKQMVDARKKNKIKSKFVTKCKSYVDNNDFISIMNTKLPSNSTLNNEKKQTIKNKIREKHIGNLALLNSLYNILKSKPKSNTEIEQKEKNLGKNKINEKDIKNAMGKVGINMGKQLETFLKKLDEVSGPKGLKIRKQSLIINYNYTNLEKELNETWKKIGWTPGELIKTITK